MRSDEVGTVHAHAASRAVSDTSAPQRCIWNSRAPGRDERQRRWRRRKGWGTYICGCAAVRLGSSSRVTSHNRVSATCSAHNASFLLPIMTSVEPAISSAHRALAIQEHVAAIVAHADQRSTAALARTSRGLCEPALDSLWEMPKVWDLARQMRPQLYIITRSTKRVREVTLVICLICCVTPKSSADVRRAELQSSPSRCRFGTSGLSWEKV
jgi:hypothetical protein